MKSVFVLVALCFVSQTFAASTVTNALADGYENLTITKELYVAGFSPKEGCESVGSGPQADLTKTEIFALCFYTGLGFGAINKDLALNKGKGFKTIIKAIDKAIEKLPKVSGTFERGGELSDEQIKELKVGSKVKYRTFTGLMKSYPWFRPVTFKITSKNVRDISHYAAQKGYVDFLIERDAKFEIKEVKSSDGLTEVIMEQL